MIIPEAPVTKATQMRDSNESSPVLLRVSVPRSQSAIGVLLCLLMTAICVWAFWRTVSGPSSVPRLVSVFVGLIGLAMLLGTLAFIRMLLRPPITLDATASGLVTYLNVTSGRYSADGVLIPWHSINHIEFYSSSAYSFGNQLRVKSARLYLAPDHRVPISDVSILRKMSLPFGIDGSRNLNIDWDNTVFLNAATSFGKPEAYVAKLDDLRKRYAGATLAP